MLFVIYVYVYVYVYYAFDVVGGSSNNSNGSLISNKMAIAMTNGSGAIAMTMAEAVDSINSTVVVVACCCCWWCCGSINSTVGPSK